jgi:hypothetical protein
LETAADGKKVLRDRDSMVYGLWYNERDVLSNSGESLLPVDNNTTSSQIYPFGYSIDGQSGIVMFAEQVYKNSTPNGIALTPAAADLRLRASCYVRDAKTQAPERYVRERQIGSRDEPTRYVGRDDLALRYIPVYSGFSPTKISGTSDNKVDVNKEADHYLNQLQAEYQAVQGQTLDYAGLMVQELDGALQQITWSITRDGTTTTICRNSEQRWREPPYVRRRERERALARENKMRSMLGDIPGMIGGTLAKWSNTLGQWIAGRKR